MVLIPEPLKVLMIALATQGAKSLAAHWNLELGGRAAIVVAGLVTVLVQIVEGGFAMLPHEWALVALAFVQFVIALLSAMGLYVAAKTAAGSVL